MSSQTDIALKQTRKRRWPTVAFLFLAVLIGVTFLIFYRTAVPEDTPPEITFVRFEGDPERRESLLGVFSVRNPHRRPIRIFYVGGEKPYYGVWPEHRSDRGLSASFTFSKEILALGAETISVTPPGGRNADIWRLPVQWEMGPGFFEKAKYVVRLNWFEFRRGGSLPGWNVPDFSDVISYPNPAISLTYSPVITNSIMFTTPADSNPEDVIGEVDFLRR